MRWTLILLYPVLLVLLLCVLLACKPIRSCAKRNWKMLLLFLGFNLVVLNVLLMLHLRQEQFIPYWDFGGFYRKTLEFNAMLARSGKEAWDNLWQSMNYAEYSYLPECFLALPTMILGNTFPRFVVAMLNAFIVPANLVMFMLLLMISEKAQKNKRGIQLFGGLIISLFAGNLFSMVLGYIGSAGLVWISAVLLLIYAGILDEFHPGYDLAMGLMLILILLLRRWFAYWIVGFFISFVLAEMIRQGLARKLDKKRWTMMLGNLFVMGIVPLTILVTLFFPLFKTITTYDYAKAYSVAKVDGFLGTVRWFFEYYGLFLIALMAWGLISGSRRKEQQLFTWASGFQILTAVILFNRVQNMGSHHYYIINAPAMILILLAVVNLAQKLSVRLILMLSGGLACMQTLVFSKTIFFARTPWIYQSLQKVNLIFSAPLPELRIRRDNQAIRELADYLNAQAQEYEYVYTLSNTVLFNDDMLRNAHLPETLEAVDNLLTASAYDYRDGVPHDFFQYFYIVVANPIQLQFGEEGQRCVSVLADLMLHDAELGQYYSVVKEVMLDNGIKVKVYRRIDQIPNIVRQRVSDLYRSYYPEDPDLYTFTMLSQ